MGRLKSAVVGLFVVLIGLAVVAFLTKDNIPKDTNGDIPHGDTVEVVNPLEKNQQEDILQLIEDYYSKLASKDAEGLEMILDKLDNHMIAKLERNKKFVEGYQNIRICVKDGAKENEYIVFSYYEMKINHTDTPIPGIGTHYVKQNSDGAWQIIDGYQNCEIQEAIIAEVPDADIQQLLKEVQQKYTKAIESDMILKKTIEELQSDRL